MLFAVLEVSDYVVIALLILNVIIASGGAAASTYRRPAAGDRLQRIEHKLDLILTHLGINYVPPPKTAWQELADSPTQKIAAIKAYRELHGVGLAEAKKAVEDYIEGKSK